MEPKPNDTPLVAIVGETGAGKTALALWLAERFQGEIICADSRTVYEGMDIGTAKPTAAEQAQVPHHVLDVVLPAQHFAVSDFKQLADEAVEDITRRGKVPFLVGGTGLYVDAVVHDYQFRGAANPAVRREWGGASAEQLQAALTARGIPLPSNASNPRHLIRTLETAGTPPAAGTSRRRPVLYIGVSIPREALRAKIVRRVDNMVAQGLVDEVKKLVSTYGWDVPALQAPGYKAFRSYLEGNATLDQAKEAFVQADMQLAKRQRTWFKRNKSIHWISKREEAVDLVTTILSK